MNNNLKQLISEQFSRTIAERKRYMKTRAVVEGMVREALLKRINEDMTTRSKAMQVRQALNDPAINKSGLARKIDGLSGNDDARRSEISKIARGEWTPDTSIQNDILHTIASDTE